MYVDMPAKEERIHMRIEDEIKEGALAVAGLRGLTRLTTLVTNLLKEEINKEIRDRPEMFADALKKVKEEASGIKRSVPIGLRANAGNHVNRRSKASTLARKKGSRKR